MTWNPKKGIENKRAALEAGERGGDGDRDLLLEFSDQLKLLKSEYSDHRHLKLLSHCVNISEGVEGQGALAAALREKSAAEDAVRWIHDEYENPETNRDYRIALRQFGRHLADSEDDVDDHGIPPSLSWVPSKTPRSYDPQPDPAKLYSWDEAEAMIDVAANNRDKAMVAVLMEAGPRGGEFYELNLGDVTDATHGLQLRVDGKTGQRSVTMIPFSAYLRRWLADHPGASPSDPLWSKLSEPSRISKQRMYQILQELGDRAGIDERKPRTPTNFRKSNATHLAREGAKSSIIEDRQGRARGSKAVARYVARFGKEGEESAYARHLGIEIDDGEEEQEKSVPCPRCGRANLPGADECEFCRQALEFDENTVQTGGTNIERMVREAVRETVGDMLGAGADGDLTERSDVGLQTLALLAGNEDLPDPDNPTDMMEDLGIDDLSELEDVEIIQSQEGDDPPAWMIERRNQESGG